MSGRDSQPTVPSTEPVILPYAEMAKKAERDGVDIMVYVNSMHAHVLNQRDEINRLKEQCTEVSSLRRRTDQANAWVSVWERLTQIDPQVNERAGSGLGCALHLINELASRPEVRS